MEITICDISAFDYWRTPPIVHLLLCGDESDPALAGLASESDTLALREAVATLPLCASMLRPSPATRGMGSAAKTLVPAVPLLAANHAGPIDILVGNGRECHSSSLIKPRLAAYPAFPGTTSSIEEYISVVSPGYALLQLAGRASLARCCMLASEICGTFAVYKPPAPIQAALQKIADARSFPQIGGWAPFIDASGRITDLWSRPTLATPKELQALCAQEGAKRGRGCLKLAAQLIQSGAASPFEARAGILLGFSRRRGGEGHAGFSFNKRIDLTPASRSLARRDRCYCDLFWEDGLDVECQSAMVHDRHASFLSDSERTIALRHMGIDVLPVTYGQLLDERRFEALSKTISSIRGLEYRPKTARQTAAASALRKELFADWETIHRV